MLDKLEALKTFCIAAETLQFKETANRLAVSPPVVTRMIAELESLLGEPLFQRNTRQIQLTDFGQSFLPKAHALLAESEVLFRRYQHQPQEMKGIVRIALPEIAFEFALMQALHARLQPYPDIVLDWRIGGRRLNVTENQIDIGLRIGFARDSRLIVKKVGTATEHIVCTPQLAQKQGNVANVQELTQKYPLIGLLDDNTGRAWAWQFADEQFLLRSPAFMADNMYSAYYAAKLGVGASLSLNMLCQQDLMRGNMVELLPDVPKIHWDIYLYRPERNVTPYRVSVIFGWLTEILTEMLKNDRLHFAKTCKIQAGEEKIW